MGFGEAQSGNLTRIKNKPGVSKGGQLAIVSATNRIRPYWYQHRHKLNDTYGPGFKAQGQAEVRSCIDVLKLHVQGKYVESHGYKKIFIQPPHLTFDNHFSGEEVCKYAGQEGFGLLTTCRRDRIPKGIKSEHVNKQKTDASKRCKVARFVQPVIAVKSEQSYDIVLTSFQSTSSCNIISVNSLDSNKNFVEARASGRGNNKRFYVIEQNAARLLYLKTYSRIDSIDHLIKNCKVGYCCWKYWHSPVNHAKSLAAVTAYDMYLEVCEGKLDTAWKVDHPCDFFTFRDILSQQMCKYDPKNQNYPGDERMRVVTQLSKKQRGEVVQAGTNGNNHELVSSARGDGSGRVTFEQFKHEKQNSTRFCYDLTKYEPHLHKLTSSKSSAKCVVCGVQAYKRCVECQGAGGRVIPIHCYDKKGAGKDKNCHILWHSPERFGLCFADRSLVEKKSGQWTEPTPGEVRSNRKLIKEYKKRRR